MIKSARFFGFGTNIARREYPIIRNELSEPIKEFESVKCSVNFGQTIQVPYFSEIDQCDYVQLGNKWYYITNVAQATNKNNSLDITIRLSVPTTLLNESTQLQGDFTKTPYRVNYRKNAKGFSDGTMKKYGSTELLSEFDIHIVRYKQGEPTDRMGVCWVQITSNTPSCPVFEITEDIDQSSYNTYGFPCLYYLDKEELCSIRVPVNNVDYDYQENDGYHINSSVWMQIGDTPFFYYIGSHLLGHGKVFPGPTIINAYKKWKDDNTYRWTWADLGIWADEEVPNDWVDEIPMAVRYMYPSMNDIVNNPDEALGIPASSIMDMSISMYCPYEVETSTGDFRSDIYGYTFTDIPRRLMSKRDIAVDPNKATPPIEVSGYTIDVSGTPVQYAESLVYYGVDGGCCPTPLKAMEWHQIGVQIDESVHDTGSIELKDSEGNTFLEIPMDYVQWDSDNGMWILNYRWKCWNDNMGVYIYVDFGYTVRGTFYPYNLPIMLPCGKLPYMGDTWNEYRVYQLANDRDAIDQATLESVLGAVSSLVGVGSGYATDKLIGGMNTGNAAAKAMPVVGAVSQVASTAIGTGMSIWSMNEHQKLKERATKRAPGTGYHTGYGFQYLFRAITNKAGIYLYSPVEYTSEKLTQYRKWNGYENEGYDTVRIRNGHIEGSLYNVLSPKLSAQGPMMTELIELIASGINLRIIIGD